MSFPVAPSIQIPWKRLLLGLSVLTFVGCGSSPKAYVERGNHFFDGAKYDDARIQYQKAIQQQPNLGEAHYRMGLLELQKNQPLAAYKEMQRATELMPGNSEVLFKFAQLALTLYTSDRQHPQQPYQQASKAAEQLYAKDPKGFEGNILKGALALIGKKSAEGLGYIRAAIQAKPADLDARLGLARALVMDNQAQAGIDAGREIIQKDKAFGPAYDFLFEQYRTVGKVDEARNILKLKVANNPKQASFILELARYYAASGNTPEMTATLQLLLSKPNDFPEANVYVGDFYVALRKPDEALKQYEQGLGLSVGSKAKDAVTYRKRIVRVLFEQKKWPLALAQVNAVLKDHPGDEEIKLVRALLWLDEAKPENLDPAIAELRSQLVKRPKDQTLHMQIGNALVRKGDSDGARQEWTAAAQQNRSYLPPRFSLVQMDLAQGKGDAAVPIAEEIIALAPRDAQARLLFATSLISAGQFSRAHSELGRLIAQFPKSFPVRFRLGTLALAEKKFKDAEDLFHRIQIEAPGNPEVVAGLAQAYQGQNQSAKAVQLLGEELKRNPTSSLLRQTLARTAMADGKSDIAIEQYKLLASAAPKAAELQLSLANAYMVAGDSAAAIVILKKAVEAQPKLTPASLELAHAYLSAGQMADAKALYRHMLQIEPNNANALNDLAYVMADAGENLDEAMTLAQRGLQNTTSAGLKISLSDTLGWIYLKKSMYDSALQTFQSLVSSNPHDPTFRYHLGATLYKTGDKRKAKVELETALASKPTSSDEPKIRKLLAEL